MGLYMFGRRLFPRGRMKTGVYIDDIGGVEQIDSKDPRLVSGKTPGAILFEQFDSQIENSGLVRHDKKDIRLARSGRLWGGWLEGVEGWWGSSLGRRLGTSVSLFELAARGGNRWVYQSTYGMACFVLLFLFASWMSPSSLLGIFLRGRWSKAEVPSEMKQ